MGKLRALEELFLSWDSKSFSFLGWGGQDERDLPTLNFCTIFCFFSKAPSHLGLFNTLPLSFTASGHQGPEFSTSSQTPLQKDPHLKPSSSSTMTLPAIPFPLPPNVSA